MFTSKLKENIKYQKHVKQNGKITTKNILQILMIAGYRTSLNLTSM